MNTERIKQAMAQLATLNAKIASNSACNASSEENHANAIEIVLEALQSFLELGIAPEQMLEIDKLYAEKCRELAEEKKKYRWIPCSERMPEEAGKYEVTAYNGHRFQTTQVKWQPKLKSWNLSGAMAYWKIIAWKPLIEPYRGDRCESTK